MLVKERILFLSALLEFFVLHSLLSCIVRLSVTFSVDRSVCASIFVRVTFIVSIDSCESFSVFDTDFKLT